MHREIQLKMKILAKKLKAQKVKVLLYKNQIPMVNFGPCHKFSSSFAEGEIFIINESYLLKTFGFNEL